MPDFGSIVPVELTENRKLELEAQMALAFEVLFDASYAIHRSDDPVDIRRLRDRHLKHGGTKDDPLRCYPGARRCIAGLRLIEQEVLSGYIRTLSALSCSTEEASKKDPPGLDFQDCVDEAAWAIWDSMYVYNGRYRFTTFIYHAAKNRLISLLRKHSRDAECKATQEAIERVVRGEDLNDMMTHDGEEIDLMWTAVQNTHLTTIERELIEAHLRGDRKFRGRMCKTICPETGNLYTRAWLSQIFTKACAKIRDSYANPNKVAA